MNMSVFNSNITYFNNIPREPDRKSVLVRLGHKKSVTMLDNDDRQLIDQAVKLGILLCDSKGAAGRLRIVRRESDTVVLENSLAIKSAGLAKVLSQSDEVLLMASSAGKKIVERVHHEVKHGNAALGVILDAYASQKADASLDWVEDFMYKTVRREGKKLARHRYSPGYGDLSLSLQKDIYDILSLNKLGLSLTEKYMLVPEKSVIAIAGVEKVLS